MNQTGLLYHTKARFESIFSDISAFYAQIRSEYAAVSASWKKAPYNLGTESVASGSCSVLSFHILRTSGASAPETLIGDFIPKPLLRFALFKAALR